MKKEFFIRYYISENARRIDREMQTIIANLTHFDGWLWTPVNRFDYKKSFGYLPGSNEVEIEYTKSKSLSVVEHHDPDSVIGHSLIWTYGKRSHATVIDDLLTLCSIAESRYIYTRIVEACLPDVDLQITHRPIAPMSDLKEIIPRANLQSFVCESLDKLQQQTWKDEIGFIPAIIWYSQAQRSFRASIFSLELSLYWVVLEVLASAYVQRQGLSARMRNKKERVKKLIDSYGFLRSPWSFINSAIDDWYEVRCASFHEGKLPSWSNTKFEQRWRQLAEFVSFILASLLQKQDAAWENQIAARISAY